MLTALTIPTHQRPALARLRFYLRLVAEGRGEAETHSHPPTPGMIAAFQRLVAEMDCTVN